MMPQFIYTATRSLKDGIPFGGQIIFDTPLVSFLPTNHKEQRVRTALSGRKRRRVIHRSESLACVSPVAITQNQFEDWVQLLDSIDDGQTFTLDNMPYSLDDTWQKKIVNRAEQTWRFEFTLYRVRA